MSKMIIALLAGLSLPCVAAQTLKITDIDDDYTKTVSIKSSIYSGKVNAGAMELTTDKGTMWGFCVDLYDTAHTGTFEISTLENAPRSYGNWKGPMTEAKADNVQKLFDVAYYDYVLPELEKTPAQANKDITAGFQLAVWNLIYDNDLSVSKYSGSFYTTSKGTFVDYANLWMSQLNTSVEASVTALLSCKYQDFVVGNERPVDLPDPAVVPAPSALLLSSIGAGIASFFRRRNAV